MQENTKAASVQMSPSDELNWLSGGGEMGALIRSMDWSSTPLGPVETWPQSLRTSVSLCLSSTFPILVAWGPEDIQIYNDSYRPICGAKHPESMGQNFKVCWATALPVVGDAFDRAHRGEGTYIRDQRMFLDRNGYLEEAFMTFSFSPIRDESGNVGGIFHPITENTDQVLGARRTQSLRDLSVQLNRAKTIGELGGLLSSEHPNLLPDLPFILFYKAAPDGVLHLCANAGLPADAPLAPATVDLSADGGWPFAAAARSRAIEEVLDLEHRFGRVDCAPYPEAPTSALILPISVAGMEQPYGYVVAGVSARRALDAEYRSFYELLMNTVNTAVGNITAYEQEQKRAEVLAEIDRAKTAFFSNVSHEFRTPLSLIFGPLDDSLTDPEEPLGPRQRARLEVTHRNALRLLKLVNSLLDFSKIEAGRAQAVYAPLDLSRLTLDLTSVFRSAMEKAGLDFDVAVSDLPEPVHVDRDMWEKIVFNLLSNAFKFTMQGAVQVRLERHGNAARLSVRDTGSGIPDAELPRVFERFHRVEGAQGRSFEGTGIGLALIQELVKLHGGHIHVESRVGVGSVFYVDIPFGTSHLPAAHIAATPADERAGGAIGAAFVEEALRWLPEDAATRPADPHVAEAPAAAVRQRARVLVVDDNSDMRNYVKGLLERDMVVETCADGEEALAAVLRKAPDLLLSDVMMPRLDGFGLLKKIRATEAISHVPVILLSARAGEEARIEGLQAGADDYLVKPFAANELLARVKKQIDQSRERRSARKALEESEAYFRSLVDSSPAMLWITDAGGRCTYLSKRWFEYTGRRPADGPFLNWLQSVHPEEQQRVERVFMAANSEHAPFVLDYRSRRHDGEFRWVIDSGAPRFDADGSFLGYIGSVIDVHERKGAEQKLQLLADELFETNRRKSEFLATLAHELRNPLAPIRNGLEVMRLTAGNTTAWNKVRDMMERQVFHMVHLVDDLLDVARISSGKVSLRKERVELHRIVANAVETSLPLMEAASHHLTIDMTEEVLALDGDPVRLSQVLSNLLNNAAKYTPNGGHIDITAYRAGSEAIVSVTDTGVGIPAESLPEVFEMFTQVGRNMERSQGGLGIGLSLAHRLIELHGGTISAVSAGSGRGSVFTVRLPLAADAGPAPFSSVPGAAGADSAATGLRVLVVDDNTDAAQSLAELLELGGHATLVVDNGHRALQEAQAFRPDLVILDIGMPGMNGYEVAKVMRKTAGLEHAVLVALTGWGSEADRARALEAGFDQHLTKPVEFSTIDRMLTAARRARLP